MSIEEKIQKLGFQRKLLFGLSMTERILHFYNIFDTEYNLNWFKTTNKILNKLYDDSLKIDKNICKEYKKQLHTVIPDSDEFGEDIAIITQNAGIALSYCLDFCIENDLQSIKYIIQKVEETIDSIILDILDKDDEISLKNIEEDKIIQNNLLDLLSKTDFNIELIRDFTKQNKIEIENFQ